MSERRPPTREEVSGYLQQRRNRGRWGQDDQIVFLVIMGFTATKRVTDVRQSVLAWL